MRTIEAILLALAFATANASPASATNIYFLPGDAFFHTELSENDIQELEKGGNVLFRYQRPDYAQGAFCGYAGYGRLIYPDAPEGLRSNLAKSYRELRKQFNKKIEILEMGDLPKRTEREANAFRMLIYNRTYDVKGRGIYVKYNENWTTEALGNRVVVFPGRPAPTKAGKYEPFLRDADSIMREWRDAADVPPLEVAFPTNRDMESSGLINSPIQLKGSPVFVIVPSGTAQDFSKPKPGTELLLVNESSVTKLVFSRKNGWQESKED